MNSEISNLKVLIADDEEGIREILGDIVESCGHAVTKVENGKIALDAYLESPDSFDLIISDARMPVMDGFELVQKIRSNKDIKQPKMVILSGSSKIELQEKDSILLNKIDGCLPKPFSMNELVSMIDNFSK